MANAVCFFLSCLFLLFLSWFTPGCRFESKEVRALYNQYSFDSSISAKLPLYDSLVAVILENASFFKQRINEKDSYRSYSYMPYSTGADMGGKLPPEIAPKVDYYFNQLGRNYIYGFDVFKDSTVKIHIRRNMSGSSPVNILEYLSYYPSGSRMQKRIFPVKDTVLSDHWQYWILFDKPRLPI